MKLQQRRIGEETTRNDRGDIKYRTIDINFDDLDYADTMNKQKNASPQRDDAADGSSIAVPEGVRAQSRSGSNA